MHEHFIFCGQKLQAVENHDFSNVLKVQNEALSQGSNSSINLLTADDTQIKKSTSNDPLEMTGESREHELSTPDDGLRVQISPEKTLHMPHLSEAQKKAITGKSVVQMSHTKQATLGKS